MDSDTTTRARVEREPWPARARRQCRRPIGEHEIPYMEALGASIRAAREEAGLSRRAVAEVVMIREDTVSEIEHAARRTRRSTLEGIAKAIAVPVEPWVEIAGPALAPESQWKDRIARRRRRRARKREREREREAMRKAALKTAREDGPALGYVPPTIRHYLSEADREQLRSEGIRITATE